MNLPRFTLAHWFPNGNAFHISRVHREKVCPLHTHEFVEVFWVVEGVGVHHVNSGRQPLSRGTLVAMRPDDYHGFRSRPDTVGLSLVNVSFLRGTLDFLRERYFADTTNFFWATTPLPFVMQTSSAQLNWLQSWASRLMCGPRTRPPVECFLLELILTLRTPAAVTDSSPPWLQHALEAVREPQHFRGGTPSFARLAGRTPQHVNYALKKHCGLTATEVVNRARMEYAAAELMMSTEKVVEICYACGFQNLGHFYEVFQKHYGTTPRLYRQHQRAMMS